MPKFKVLSGPLMLDDDTASLVIEKSLGYSSRSSFSDTASLVAASQSKSAIGGFQFDPSLFEADRRERTASASMPSNGLIDLVQSNSEMKAAKTMLAMASKAAAANASSAVSNDSDTASDEEMEHLQHQQDNKNTSNAASMILQPRPIFTRIPSPPQIQPTQPAISCDDDDDKPLNLSSTSNSDSSNRVYQVSNQQIFDLYIDKFLNTGTVCNSNGYANAANDPRSRDSSMWIFCYCF